MVVWMVSVRIRLGIVMQCQDEHHHANGWMDEQDVGRPLRRRA